jgi:hypothetical protein
MNQSPLHFDQELRSVLKHANGFLLQSSNHLLENTIFDLAVPKTKWILQIK